MKANWRYEVVHPALLRGMGILTLSAALFVATAPTAFAAPVVAGGNGSFEMTTNGVGQLGSNTNLTGWNVNSGGGSFAFVLNSASGNSGPGQFGSFSLNGGTSNQGTDPINNANGANPQAVTASPDGGNYVALDGAFQRGPINTTVTGLTVGDSYLVEYDYAAAQQTGFYGATTDNVTVSMTDTNGITVSSVSPTLSIGEQQFSGWQAENFQFTATTPQEMLSFLAFGTPDGMPPFSLIDGVQVVHAPEIDPGSAVLPLALVAGFLLVAWDRRRKIRPESSPV
jgi:hypothetical protein